VIRILVVEGDADNRNQLLECIAKDGEVSLVAECRDMAEAAEKAELLRPDVIYASTETPRFNGIAELFARLAGRRPYLVVMSPSGQYAAESFMFNVVDYLLTPVCHERFRASLLKLRRIMQADQQLERRMDLGNIVSCLREYVTQAQEDERVSIKFGGRFRFISMKGIRYASADRDYADIHMATGEVLHSTNRLAEIAGKLPAERFLRIRRSIVVNIDYVREVRAHKENYELLMDNGIVFRPGTTYKVKVRAALVKRKNQNGGLTPPRNHLDLLAKG